MYAVICVQSGLRESVFPTGKEAGELAKAWNESAQQHLLAVRYRVVKLTEDETADITWKEREFERFRNGTYKLLPWHAQSFAKAEHYAHVSQDDPEKVAFTPDSAHGREDRQLRMRPGRYLALLGVHNGDVKKWCAAYAESNLPIEIKFAETADDIESVYVNGPQSCMAWYGAHNNRPRPDCEIGDDWGYGSSCHPVRVYAAGDLSVAYLGNLNEPDGVRERCLVWQSKKLRSRAYPEDSRIAGALDSLGYTCIGHRRGGDPEASFNGARLTRIEDDDGNLVLPYIDGNSSVEDCGDYLKIDRHGDIDADVVTGLVDVENHATCANCGDRIYDGDEYSNDNGTIYCLSCYDEVYTRCSHCEGELYSEDATYNDSGDPYCESCYEDRYVHCYECSDEIRRRDAIEHNDELYCSDHVPEDEDDSEDDSDLEPSPTINDPRQLSLLEGN